MLLELEKELWQVRDMTSACCGFLMLPEGVLSDATKSVSRAYINNFQDKGKQIAIDMFLVSVFM